MHLYIKLFGLSVPSYGLSIALGVVIANIIALFVLKKAKLDFNDFIILEAYCIMGAFLGAKLLYLIISYKNIDWKNITNALYFNQLMQSGFVFYGGLTGGLIFVFAAGKFHHINAELYIRNFIFLIPFIHCFGRIGCFFAGCCYGIPYDGPGAVVFPENSFAIPGVKLFPVQLVEALFLKVIAAIILYLQLKMKCFYTVEIYFLFYGILRFVLEFFRYDEIRGSFAGLSTSQWISVVLLLLAGGSFLYHKTGKKSSKIDNFPSAFMDGEESIK